MSAPRLINPPPSTGGVPVGGSGTVGTLPIWVGASTLGNSAVTQVAGSIFSLTGLVGGTGYANTESVALGGGTGTGATASLNVSGGGVQWVGLLNPGSGYTAGDVLTIPGGVGGTITVLAVVPKNDASGHLTAQRIGAGTAQPNAGIDSRFGAFIGGWQRNFRLLGPTVNAQLPTQLYVGGDVDASISGANFPVGLGVYTRNISTAAGAGTTYSAIFQPTAVTTSGAGTFFTVGALLASAYRSSASDLATNTGATGPQLWGVFSRCAHISGGAASYASAAIIGFRQNTFFNVGGSADSVQGFVNNTSNITNATAIGTYYAFREQGFALSGGATIGTYYGLRLEPITGTAIANKYPHAQEDTDGRNYFRAPTFFGSAVGTARSATNPSVEVEAVGGVSNGDVRLRSASAVFDASNSSTNGVRFFARTTGDLPTTTTQNWYEEGTYTPTGSGWQGTLAGSWTRVGRKVFVTINLTGTPNGNAAGSTLTLPSGLAPARGGAGLRVKTATGTALGNGVCSVDPVSGLIQISTAVTVDNDSKTIQAEYEV